MRKIDRYRKEYVGKYRSKGLLGFKATIFRIKSINYDYNFSGHYKISFEEISWWSNWSAESNFTYYNSAKSLIDFLKETKECSKDYIDHIISILINDLKGVAQS